MIADIPFDDFGGRGIPLHFASANAYPPGAYRKLLTLMAADYRVLAIHHRPLWPGSQPEELKDWDGVADDLIRFFDQLSLRDVIGVGHSLGAVATMMASLKRPDLFRALVLIEPVFLPKHVLELLIAGTTLEDLDETRLIKITRERRNGWTSRQEVFDHYRSKRVFRRLSDEGMWDYVRYGTFGENGDEICLLYSPEWEAHIYSLPPTGVWELIPEVTHPTLAMRARETDTLFEGAWSLWQQLQPAARFKEFQGSGHLLPMEKPNDVAAEIKAFIAGLPPDQPGSYL
ncbi:MAG: alpha/beta hydrolase [Chloroflexota bacterium]|nr:MAG: alpha/beta hydrolase [Chloroflexota bacterium]